MRTPIVFCLALSLAAPAWAADKLTATQLIDLAKQHHPELRTAVVSTFGSRDLETGAAYAGTESDFFFAVEASVPPTLVIDDGPGLPMERIPGPSQLPGGSPEADQRDRPLPGGDQLPDD